MTKTSTCAGPLFVNVSRPAEAKKHPPAKPVARADEPRVRITEIPFGVPCALPNHNELVGLMGIVGKEFPELAPRLEYKSFHWAFTALGAMFRLPTPDRQHIAQYFREHCESWLRSHGVNVDIGNSWALAALAWGDIPWVDWRADGMVPEFGLSPYCVFRRLGPRCD